jgi:hypothetical protein
MKFFHQFDLRLRGGDNTARSRASPRRKMSDVPAIECGVCGSVIFWVKRTAVICDACHGPQRGYERAAIGIDEAGCPDWFPIEMYEIWLDGERDAEEQLRERVAIRLEK